MNSCSSATNERATRLCAICGGAGAHRSSYGVPSCEGCRQFFRRAIVNQKQWFCFVGAKCAIEKGDICRSCRLDRCLMAGMDWRAVRIPVRQSIQFAAQLEQRMAQMRRREEQENSIIADCAVVPIEQGPSSQDCSDANQFLYLLHLETRRERIRAAFYDLPSNYMDKFQTFEDLFSRNDNILALWDTFSPRPAPLSAKEMDKVLEELRQVEFFHPRCIRAILVELLLYVGVQKAMPANSKLSLEDQMLLIRHISIPLDYFVSGFYSAQLGSGTWTRRDGFKCISYFELPKYSGDKNMAKLVERVFTHSVAPFLRNPISREEFMLCLAIMHSHSAIPELSAQARELLYAESVRYSKMLMHLLQSRYGPAQGVSRYANCMHLIECAFRHAKHYGEFVIYLEAFYLRTSIANVFPEYLRAII